MSSIEEGSTLGSSDELSFEEFWRGDEFDPLVQRMSDFDQARACLYATIGEVMAGEGESLDEMLEKTNEQAQLTVFSFKRVVEEVVKDVLDIDNQKLVLASVYRSDEAERLEKFVEILPDVEFMASSEEEIQQALSIAYDVAEGDIEALPQYVCNFFVANLNRDMTQILEYGPPNNNDIALERRKRRIDNAKKTAFELGKIGLSAAIAVIATRRFSKR